MDGWTDDEQTPGSSLYPPNLSVGDKKSLKLFAIVKIGRKHEGSKWEVTEVVPLRKNGRKTQGSKQEVTYIVPFINQSAKGTEMTDSMKT